MTAIKSAYEAYEKDMKPAHDAYSEAVRHALAVYEGAISAAWGACDTRAAIWDFYAKTHLIKTDYETACLDALGVYTTATEPVIAIYRANAIF